ncbi:hypothetical protein NQ314_000836 [Rhamnusium bicolor]|uniref:Uncharacterized protein n=1 Tax=Rhamnusium bicolor TaxID=1586634 RepID=A0AAV8ZWV4_9CUCU|nr:hypothetical protein NQ314_000836 [Rhamnusium bicolor]
MKFINVLMDEPIFFDQKSFSPHNYETIQQQENLEPESFSIEVLPVEFEQEKGGILPVPIINSINLDTIENNQDFLQKESVLSVQENCSACLNYEEIQQQENFELVRFPIDHLPIEFEDGLIVADTEYENHEKALDNKNTEHVIMEDGPDNGNNENTNDILMEEASENEKNR